MAEKTPKSNEGKLRKIDFLKAIGSNPDRKATDIGQKEYGMSQSSVYNAINEFILNCIWSEDEGDFPKRILNFYNKEVPNEDEQLHITDIQALHHYVDNYYEKHLPGGNLNKEKQAVHTDEVYVPAEISQTTPIPPQQEYNQGPQQYNRMPQQPFNQQQFQKTDVTNDAGYLRTLLTQAKYVHPTMTDRFIAQYEMNKEIFDRDPIALLETMKHMFGPGQGENIWKIFQKGRGKYVYGADGNPQQGQGMDPMGMMMMMNMMNGGGMNPQMMPMMQQMMGGNGPQPYGQSGMDMNQMMWMMMLSQMGQKSQKDQQKQDMNELFEKMIQAIMLKMVGGAAEDRKPWDMYGMGMNPMMGGMMGPPQIQEVMDANGRVTQRNIVPSFGMPGMHGQNQPDPVLMSVLNNTMNTNTQLLMKITDSGKPITDILLGMIPYFKDSGNSALQLSNMFKTMNEMVPGFFGGKQQDGQNIEIAKLKLDTDLALSAQNMELQKMQHTWRIDEMDRKSNQENASNWMRMIESLGGSFSDKIAPALLEGFGKGGLMGPKGQQQPQQDPYAAQMRMQQQMMRRQQEMEQRHQMKQEEQAKDQAVQKQIHSMEEQQQMTQQQAMFAISQLQGAVAQRDQYIQNLTRQMQDIQNQPTQRYQQGGQQQITEQQLLRMGSGELQQMMREINNANTMESTLKSRIETILANRAIMDQHTPPPQQVQEPQQSAYEPGTETEDVSSTETRDYEERLPES